MPDEKNGNVIIAGHSGSARTSYFKKIDQLFILLKRDKNYKKVK